MGVQFRVQRLELVLDLGLGLAADLAADTLPVHVETERDYPTRAPRTGLVMITILAIASMIEVDAVFAIQLRHPKKGRAYYDSKLGVAAAGTGVRSAVYRRFHQRRAQDMTPSAARLRPAPAGGAWCRRGSHSAAISASGYQRKISMPSVRVVHRSCTRPSCNAG